ncbi:MAG: hypothetical protein K8R02_03380 [Anaerohalosphaeraceae bacterium]|nr:hypothetical protein [Anaerohalosphaeraceae bacterium]
MFNVLESPMLLSLVAAASVIVVWVLRAIYPAKMNWRCSLVPVLIIAIALGLDFFVKTDSEKIRSAVTASIKSFRLKQIEPIASVIAGDYSDQANGSRDVMIAYCQALFEIAPVERITLLSRQLEIEGRKGNFVSEGLVKFAEESEIAKMGKVAMLVKFRLHFKKLPSERWVVYSSDILEIDRKPISWSKVKSF